MTTSTGVTKQRQQMSELLSKFEKVRNRRARASAWLAAFSLRLTTQLARHLAHLSTVARGDTLAGGGGDDVIERASERWRRANGDIT